MSCDRAAALVTRDPLAVCRALMTIAAGEAADDLNLDAFIAQGMDYSESGSGLERMTQLLQDLGHPSDAGPAGADAARLGPRGRYDALVRGEYIRRGDEASAREEADAASAFYGDRISGAFQAAGSSIGDVGQQLGDWLKKRAAAGTASSSAAPPEAVRPRHDGAQSASSWVSCSTTGAARCA